MRLSFPLSQYVLLLFSHRLQPCNKQYPHISDVNNQTHSFFPRALCLSFLTIHPESLSKDKQHMFTPAEWLRMGQLSNWTHQWRTAGGGDCRPPRKCSSTVFTDSSLMACFLPNTSAGVYMVPGSSPSHGLFTRGEELQTRQGQQEVRTCICYLLLIPFTTSLSRSLSLFFSLFFSLFISLALSLPFST